MTTLKSLLKSEPPKRTFRLHVQCVDCYSVNLFWTSKLKRDCDTCQNTQRAALPFREVDDEEN